MKNIQIIAILSVYALSLFLSSCYTTKSLTGQTYITNFPAMGFFSTKLTFNSDSTYKKYFSGDMISKKDSGTYQIIHKKLILKYKVPPLDSSFYKSFKEIGNTINLDSFVKVNSLNRERTDSATYFLRKDKIFFSEESGRISRKNIGYSKRKKYIFFGSHNYDRKHYMKKVE